MNTPIQKKGFHPDWNSLIFNFERPEIQSFLISSAFFWMEKYHIDGLRVDAVASMLYLDYSRDDGEWEPNEYGGNHNLGAISFLKALNEACYSEFEGISIIAEESTAFPGVSKPVHEDGLGFGFKWMMGWMNDTLAYMERDAVYRKYHHGEISFSMTYAYSETYILPLSHDEVVHGKRAMVRKMPGDEWQQFANLRLLYGYMYSHPGHKLLFMGNDIGQTSEWDTTAGVLWELTQHDPHRGIQNYVKALNFILKKDPALYALSFDSEGFTWVSHDDHENCVLAYCRNGQQSSILVVLNFTPNTHTDYRLGVPEAGVWEEILNSDSTDYWGSGVSNPPSKTEQVESHGFDQSLRLSLPPLSCIYLKLQHDKKVK